MQVNVGDVFGRWTVVGGPERRPYNRSTQLFWLVRCSCGTERWAPNQLFPRSQSCGCKQRERARQGRSHGQSKTRLYRVWIGMKSRCQNPQRQEYSNYGGRGITVCSEWAEDFPRFRDWALDAGYAPGLDLDRVDNDGPYSPENCRWVTRSANLRNTRHNRVVLAWGEEQSLVAWSEDQRCVVGYKTLMTRLKLGWAPERALSQPVKDVS